MPSTVQAVVALGSNIAPRAKRLEAALAAIAALPRTRIIKVGSVIETEPVDVPAEFSSLRFLNQIVLCETSLEALDFLHRMQEIEIAQGRVRGPVRNAPRTIDLDLIAFGDLVCDGPELTLPHPRARQRAFVTEPLFELIPDFVWPDE